MVSPDFTNWTTLLLSVLVSLFVFAVVQLVGPIIFPRIIAYPWPETGRPDEKNTTVVLAGSYNPPHYGHLAMLSYLSQRYGTVIAVIGMNPNKKYPVTPDERASILRKMLRESDTSCENVRVEVVTGYVWRHVKKKGASIFFRGIRSWAKDGREERGLQILNTWGPLLLGPLTWPIPTVYLEGKPEFNHVSSTLVRNVCTDGSSSLQKLVPASIADDVARLYKD